MRMMKITSVIPTIPAAVSDCQSMKLESQKPAALEDDEGG